MIKSELLIKDDVIEKQVIEFLNGNFYQKTLEFKQQREDLILNKTVLK